MGSSSLLRLFLEEGLAEIEEGRPGRWTGNGGGGGRRDVGARQKVPQGVKEEHVCRKQSQPPAA